MIVAIVQARMGSSRLPGKVMRPIGGKPMIDILLERLTRSDTIDKIVVAIPDTPGDDALAAHLSSKGQPFVRGSETDVLGRFKIAADHFPADHYVRITGDCPLIDPTVADHVITEHLNGGYDYTSNCRPATYPDGLDTEVFKSEAFYDSEARAQTPFQREHVTPHLGADGDYTRGNVIHTSDLSDMRWTVDEPEDLEVVKRIFTHFDHDTSFSMSDILALYESDASLFEANRNFSRNEGAKMGEGQKLWRRAKKIIPGGNMLLSKRSEMFLPEHWPSYFSKTEGIHVWDMDGNRYTDMSIMGIGTNTLGYSHPEVDDAVRSVIDKGNMSTFNAPEEVYLAEKLVDMHPWADMVRFARTGGEANAVCVRIARAAAGKDKIAICGYHGWHDWYLSVNVSGDGLKDHLLPGLEPNGVPAALRGTTVPFMYGDYEGLEKIIQDQDIGVIKMEVSRTTQPNIEFLKQVRKLATDNNIILIFDECTSGFRQAFGGLHLLYGVEPDMMVLGKTLGNGYAVTAVVGRGEIMSNAQTTFISSTFWTERIGSVAALKTLEVMEREKSWEKITQTGETVKQVWSDLAQKYELDITHWGLSSLAGFTINSQYSAQYKTFITQEMMKKGFIAGNSLYACTQHTPEAIEEYAALMDPVFARIKDCEQSGSDANDLLDGPVCHTGFKRLN